GDIGVYLAGRAAMALTAVASLVVVYRLGRRFSETAARAAVLVLAFLPRFVEKTTEVRPAAPALVAWLLAVVGLVRGGAEGRPRVRPGRPGGGPPAGGPAPADPSRARPPAGPGRRGRRRAVPAHDARCVPSRVAARPGRPRPLRGPGPRRHSRGPAGGTAPGPRRPRADRSGRRPRDPGGERDPERAARGEWTPAPRDGVDAAGRVSG